MTNSNIEYFLIKTNYYSIQFLYFLIFLILLAGDHVKFGFPAAAAMTVLAWSGISYEAGYRSAGEFNYLLDAVKWGTDYFIKCHVADNEFYGQVDI